MQQLTSIIAANHEGVIGVRNGLPWRLKTDLKFFKATTSGNVVIMGRKTFDSLGGRCLPNRENIVLTRGFEMFASEPGCQSAGSIAEGLAAAEIASKGRLGCFVIGGASMYEQFKPYVDRYLITRVDKNVPEGDTRFRTEFLVDSADWDLVSVSHHEAQQPDDEVSFHIFEWVSRRADEVCLARQQVIDTIHNRRLGVRKGTKRKSTAATQPVYARMF